MDDVHDQLRAHVAALVKQRDAARKMAHEFGYKCGDYFFAWPLDSPDLTALVEQERKRDAVIAAAREAARFYAPPFDVQHRLMETLRALDTPKPLENE